MKNKSFFSRLFAHDSVLLIIAFIIAFVAWFIINANSDAENKITISEIPINIDMQDESLKVFRSSADTASVEVSGNRIIIGSITAADLLVSAGQDTVVDTPGDYELNLSVKKSGVKTNYAIDSSTLEPQKIDVFVDYEKEAEFEIDNQMVYKVDNDHYASAALSDTTVTISGPESMISKVASVAIMGTIDAEKNDDTVSMDRKLIYLDSEGNELSNTYIESNIDTVKVTLNVYPVKDIELALNVIDQPKDAPAISLTPSKIRVAGPQDVLNTIEDDTFTIGNFDYSDYSNEKVNIYMDISLPNGLKNLSSDTSVNVQTDLTDYKMKTVSCEIESSLKTSSYKTEFNFSNIDIIVVGPEGIVETIADTDISVIADFTSNMSEIKSSKTLSLNIPLEVVLGKGYESCWVYGVYTADVTVSKK